MASGHTTPNKPSISHPKYRADIDGLRAVAVLAVVGFHAFPDWLGGGFIGVDIFFIISGFLISSILFTNLDRRSFSFSDFYSRRIKRIFPALLTVLVSCFVFGWFALLGDEFKQLGKHIAGGAGFIDNLLLWKESGYFDNVAESKPLLHLWSLGIEEQFYIIWPLLLWCAWRARVNLFLATLLVALASFAVNIHLSMRHDVAAFYSPQSRFWELQMGSMLAYATLYQRQAISSLMQHYAAHTALLGAVLIGLGIVCINRESVFPGWWALLPTLGAMLIIVAGPQAWFNRVILSSRLLVWFGLISFPLYLWHWPLLSLMRLVTSGTPPVLWRVAAVATAIALAWLTYRLIEKPLRAARNNRAIITWLLVLMIAVAGSGAYTYLKNGYTFRTIIGQKRALISTSELKETGSVGACQLPADVTKVLSSSCLLHSNPDARTHIVVWGDSHAESWLPVFARIAELHHYQLTVISTPGCPAIAGIRRSDGISNFKNCAETHMTTDTMNAIIGLHPNLLVLASDWTLYANGFRINGVTQPASHFLTTEADATATLTSSRQVMAEQIPLTLSTLKAQGIPLIVFKSPPQLLDNIRNLRKSYAELQPTQAEHEQDSHFVSALLDHIPGLEVFDPATKLCQQTCRASADGQNIYADDNHLTVFGSLFFEPEIDALIERKLTQ